MLYDKILDIKISEKDAIQLIIKSEYNELSENTHLSENEKSKLIKMISDRVNTYKLRFYNIYDYEKIESEVV